MQHFMGGALFDPASALDTELSNVDRQALLAAIAGSTQQSGTAEIETVLCRARIGILHRDLHGRVLLVNHAFCALVGRPAGVLDGLDFASLTHPDDVARFSRTYGDHLARGEPFAIEQRYLRPDGSAIWCSVHVSFVPGIDGRPRSAIFVASDVTARRHAEARLRESEEHYRHAVELNPQITWLAGANGAVLEVSCRWHEVTGIAREKALGESWVAALHPEDRALTRQQWAASLASRQPVDVEYRLMTASGEYRWFRARASARLNAEGEVIRWYGTIEDVHDRRLAQNELRDSEERFRLAAQAAALGIWDYDALSGRREWSPEFKAMLGLPFDARPEIGTALALVVPEDRPVLKSLVQAAQAGDSSARFDVTLKIRRASDGAERWMQTSGWRMHASSGRLTRVLVTVRDVTEERTAEDRIRWIATHDTLTQVPNRFFFTQQLEQAIARAEGGKDLALVLLDVDRLKEVNDTIGHDAGDMLLKTFARRLADAFGEARVVGRLGGDEFAVLVEGVSRENLPAAIGDALEVLRQPFEHDGYACDMQATAGVSFFPRDGTGGTELLKAADIALYVGKAGRRGELSIFEPGMRAGLQRRNSMLNVARMVTRDQRVEPFYQPQIRLDTGALAGFEALLRWRHDCLGMQGPETIAVAFDDLRLAAALSDRLIDRVAHDLRHWLDAGLHPGHVAINLSPAEFRDERLAERVIEPFRRLAVPLDCVEVEITETVLLGRDSEKVAATLATFHDHGLTIALDDFGTGFASLTHLKMFPVDVIKIDRSFVATVCERSDDAAIVDTIVSLAHRLNMQVVAEGVEREDQARHLAALGCTFGQGYLYGHAAPAEAATELLRRV
ncbi:EAL and GGDEF domain-containing protein [Sphingomonas aracearum]|uniref:sensor domain-containing protein n=1 Tax=Sphingomonas aracearum TaxID=2283317 RepID=UPI0015F0B6DB|nr:EAL domain-containing protein [Sphingomonas aracearum]